MPISPVYVGSTHFPLRITWTKDDGTAVDLTGATLSMRFAPPGVTAYSGTGGFVITSAVAGTFTYTFSSNDLATAWTGLGYIQFVATYGDGTKEISDPIPFFIGADL